MERWQDTSLPLGERSDAVAEQLRDRLVDRGMAPDAALELANTNRNRILLSADGSALRFTDRNGRPYPYDAADPFLAVVRDLYHGAPSAVKEGEQSWEEERRSLFKRGPHPRDTAKGRASGAF